MNESELQKKHILELEQQLRAEHQVEEILTEMDAIDSISELFVFLFDRIPNFFQVPFRYHFLHIDKPYRREEDIRNLSHIFRAGVKEFFAPESPHQELIETVPVTIHPAESMIFEDEKNYLPLVLENAIIGAKQKEGGGTLLGYVEFERKDDPPEFLERRARIIQKILRSVRTHLERIRSYILLEEHSLLAYQDHLTEIYNRRGFFRCCKHIRLDHGHHEWSVLVLDLDFFKRINDTYGHADGDKALVYATKTIQNALCCVTEYGILPAFGRVGGEEFAIYLHKVDENTALKVGEKLRKALEEGTFAIKNGQKLSLTGSFGVYVCKEDETVESGLAKADIALYEAKRNGRNRVEIFKPESLETAK